MHIKENIRHIKFYISICFLVFFPLFADTLRNKNKSYFDSIEWEELKDLAIVPLSEAYTIESRNPNLYADTIDDGLIYATVSQLGVLDYQHVPETLLQLCDKITAGFIHKQLEASLFVAHKGFLPHFAKFLIERLPTVSYVFYSCPVFQQNGDALVQFKLIIDKNASTPIQTVNIESLFSKDDIPDFVMMEISMSKHNDQWNISYINLKGAEYADSAHED